MKLTRAARLELSESTIPETAWSRKCKFLSETIGRGGFYIFQGTLWLCFASLAWRVWVEGAVEIFAGMSASSGAPCIKVQASSAVSRDTHGIARVFNPKNLRYKG